MTCFGQWKLGRSDGMSFPNKTLWAWHVPSCLPMPLSSAREGLLLVDVCPFTLSPGMSMNEAELLQPMCRHSVRIDSDGFKSLSLEVAYYAALS